MFASLYELMLTSKGRIGRLSYFLRLLLIFPLFLLGTIAIMIVSSVFVALHLGILGAFLIGLGGLAMMVGMIWSQIALTARRYHDFDWSGKWQFVNLALGVFVLMNMSSALSSTGGMAGFQALGQGGHPDPQKLAAMQAALSESFGPFYWVANLISLGMWAHLQFRPGTDGDNRYDGESRLPGVFGPTEGSSFTDREAAPAYRAPAPAYRTAPAQPARKFASFSGEPRADFGLKR
jgi:uncharacterized membrane protein YhaH (DUF805 family)